MKNLKAKHIFWFTVVLWIFAYLPFFVPAINSLEPHVLGLPFVVFYEFVIIAIHIAELFVCAKYVWDPFDKFDIREEKGANK